MKPEVENRNKDSVFHGPYAGRDLYITMYQDSEREFVVTHNANIKPVSYFTGREAELQDLRQRVEEGRKSVLVSGMGGIGKTHICRKLFEEYLKKHADGANCPFMRIGYVEYSGDMGSSLQNCLKFKEQDSPEQNQEAAWKELEYLAAAGKLLLFVDNVNVSIGQDPSLKRLMSIPGAIVLTSRRRVFSKEFEPYRIGFLSTEKCREIYEKIRYEDVEKRLPEEEVPDLEYIVNTLAARHTITVEFLAHLAWTKNWAVPQLRDELERNGFCLEYVDEEDKLVNIQKSYETLYDMSVLTEAEQNILEAFSVFPYIPLAAETCNKWLLADAGVSEDDDVLMGLHQKGWLQFDVDQEGYTLHPVFAQFIYGKCKPKAENHLGLLKGSQECMKIPDTGSLMECRMFIPFGEKIIKKMDLLKHSKFILCYYKYLRFIPLVKILYRKLHIKKWKENIGYIFTFCTLLRDTAEYEKAEMLYKKLLEINKYILGEIHPDTVNICDSLAVAYECQGEFEKAKELYKKNLRIRILMLGEDHPHTAISYKNLSRIYVAQGEYEKAERLNRKSVMVYEKVLGEEHLETVDSYNDLGIVYEAQGEYEKAERLYKKSLMICEKVLGEEHYETASSYDNLARVYGKQGEYEKAEELHQKSLWIREKVLGEAHPLTAGSYNNLAGIYECQGKYEKAERLYQKSLWIREKVLGEEHLETVNSYNNLAGIYESQGEYEKAEELYQKSLWIREKVLGKDHPETANSYNNLAHLYGGQGEYEKAEELQQKSLRICERVLGEVHPFTATGYNNLAGLYCEHSNYKNALTYYLKAYNIFMVKLGVGHPNTQLVLKNMKIAYYEWNPKGNFDQWLEEKMKE